MQDDYDRGFVTRYIFKRLLQLIPILFGITVLSFLLMQLAGGDYVDAMLMNSGSAISEEAQAAMRHELGLDQPLTVQYLTWMGGVFAGDMGTSFVSGKRVFDQFMAALPYTVILAVASIILTMAVSIPLGILAAVKQNSVIDTVIRFLSFLGNAMPGFFLALLLLYFFAVQFPVFPVLSSGGSWQGLVLPTITLATAMSAKYIRQVRATILEELDKDYVDGARSRGIRESSIVFGGVLKSAMMTILTLVSLSIGSLLGGTAIVESIFQWPGVGKMAVDAIMMRDFPVIQAYVMWMAVIFVCVNLVADICYHVIDPRVRLGAKRS